MDASPILYAMVCILTVAIAVLGKQLLRVLESLDKRIDVSYEHARNRTHCLESRISDKIDYIQKQIDELKKCK